MDDKTHITNQPPMKTLATGVPPQKGYNIVVAGSDKPEKVPATVYDKPDGQPLKDAEVYIGQAVAVGQVTDTWCQVQRPNLDGWMPIAHVAFQPKPAQPKITWSKSQGPLYGAQHAPEVEDVRQGNLGDCYFLAPLAAIANTPTGKKLLMTIIQPASPGLFSVTFCNIDKHNTVYLNKKEDTETVDCWFPVTDALTAQQERFLYCPGKSVHDTSIPLWSAILEKAYARWNPKWYSGLDNQVCSQAIAHLTGLEPLSLHWDPESPQQAEIAWNKGTFSFEVEEDRILKNKGNVVLPNAHPESLLHVLLTASANPDCILVAGSLRKSGQDTNFLDQEYQIKDSHQYVILQVTKDGFLLLWEPKAGRVEKPLPIEKFIALFNDVLTVDCRASLFFK